MRLGMVMMFFLTARYSKFVLAIYRYLALTPYARERRGAMNTRHA